MAEFSRAVTLATHKFVKGVNDETFQNSVTLGMLRNRGKVTFNNSGDELTWRIKKKQRTLSAVGDMNVTQFTRQDLYQKATLPWRGYEMQDMISDKEKLMCRGKEAIWNYWAGMMESMRTDWLDQMNKELFYDGNASGKENNFHGFESIFGDASTSVSTMFAKCSETYAGIAMDATHGSETSTTYFSPCIVHENDDVHFPSGWTSSPLKIGRALISGTTVKGGKLFRPDVLMMSETRFLHFKNQLTASERFTAPSPEVTKLGFKSLEFDGVAIITDFDILEGDSTEHLYCLNFDQMELNMLTSQLFVAETEKDIKQSAFLFKYKTYGNLRINPRYQGKSQDVA